MMPVQLDLFTNHLLNVLWREKVGGQAAFEVCCRANAIDSTSFSDEANAIRRLVQSIWGR